MTYRDSPLERSDKLFAFSKEHLNEFPGKMFQLKLISYKNISLETNCKSVFSIQK